MVRMAIATRVRADLKVAANFHTWAGWKQAVAAGGGAAGTLLAKCPWPAASVVPGSASSAKVPPGHTPAGPVHLRTSEVRMFCLVPNCKHVQHATERDAPVNHVTNVLYCVTSALSATHGAAADLNPPKVGSPCGLVRTRQHGQD